MFKKIFTIFLLLFFWGLADNVKAGFGISPPYVKTEKPIFIGSHYEQKITLLRSSAEEDLQATITINAPEINTWISTDKGDTFELPKNMLQVPMVIKVDVPPDAEVGNYKGYINVRIAPKEKAEGATGVAIALGARINIDLDVTDQEFANFKVRKVDVPNFEKFSKPWSWPIFSYFFYKMQVAMTIENTGNVKTAPTNIHVDVYDLTEKSLLESYDNNKIKEIDSFMTEDRKVDFRTKLEPGQYWANVKIFKDDKIVRKDKLIFTVFEPGTAPGSNRMGKGPYIMMGGIILFFLIIIIALIKARSWRLVFKILYFITFPLVFLIKLILKFLNSLKVKFFKWIFKKASKYQD